jgi:predicted amidohydrolase YtcJ
MLVSRPLTEKGMPAMFIKTSHSRRPGNPPGRTRAFNDPSRSQGSARRTAAGFCVLVLSAQLAGCGGPTEPARPAADLIVHGAPVWSAGLEGNADAVAVRGEHILSVGSADTVLGLRGSDTRVVELDGGRILPGFIDNHTHFNHAGELLLGINLLDVANEQELVKRVEDTRDRLPEGSWIVGGQWGAYEQWEQGDSGDHRADMPADAAFRPDRAVIDPVTPNKPVLLWNWDRTRWLANSALLDLADADCNWPGVECTDGEPTGRLSPEAGERLLALQPAKSFKQRVAEARVALERLREHGVTGIHDITPPEQLAVFQHLHDEGELTTRVYARPTLDKWDELAEVGIRHGFGDSMLKIGGLKGFVDGIMGNSTARFYEPYEHTGEGGRWRDMMQPPEKMQDMLIGADAAGHWPQVHAIGDEAIDTLLDMYERMIEVNGESDRRLRMIHAQVLRNAQVADRMADLGVIAEMQPYHAIDDMRWMEERIGERARWAYAFRTLHDAGVMLSFGSDWPGTNASWYPSDPMQGIYAAVVRKTLDGQPEGGWFPTERVGLETALRAYTANNARAAGEETVKGRLEPGMLADIVVLDGDPFEVAPERLKDLRVSHTILGGDIIHQR